MSIVITLLTVFLVMVSLLLILITLMQRPKQEGLGAAFGGGMMNDTFGAQTTDVLQKATVWLTVAFFGIAILLTVLNTRYFKGQRDVGNVLEGVKQAQPIPSLPTPPVIPSTSPKEAAPKDPNADPAPKTEPKSETSKSTPAESKPDEKSDTGADKASEAKKVKAGQPTANKADPPKPATEGKENK